MFVETLKEHSYEGSYLSKDWLKQPIFTTSLVYITNLIELPKILLIDDKSIPTQDTNHVILWRALHPGTINVVPVLNNDLQVPTDLVERAHTHGL
ncbi:hypothetical protein V2J09_017381 [Rumex salicifolius]